MNFWPAPWVNAPCGYRTFAATGWFFDGCGLGVSQYRTFIYSTPGFFHGWSYPCVTPVWFPPAYGWGWYSYAPVTFAPGFAFNGHPGAFVPVFQPVGVPAVPWGVARAAGATPPIARGPVGNERRVVAASRPAVRPSTVVGRRRAAALVVTGDRHLRDAVADRAKLHNALDAYRRAAAAAADEPDTFLRQAIVLTALDRPDEATVAMEKAVRIDGRLADRQPPAAGLPPDPVFGDRPLGAASPLAEHSALLLAGIFGAEGSADAPNWIADRWTRRWQDGRGLIAAK